MPQSALTLTYKQISETMPEQTDENEEIMDDSVWQHCPLPGENMVKIKIWKFSWKNEIKLGFKFYRFQGFQKSYPGI